MATATLSRPRVRKAKKKTLPLREWFEQVYRPKAGKKESTLVAYLTTVRYLERLKGATVSIADVREMGVDAIEADMFARGLSVGTREIRRCAIRSMLDFEAGVVSPREHRLPTQSKAATSTHLIEFYRKVYVKRLQRANPNTGGQFLNAIRLLSIRLGRPAMVYDLTEDNILAVMNSMSERGRSPATANTIRKKLVAMMNCAAKRRMIVACEVPEFVEYKRTPTAWRIEQLTAVLESCRQQKGTVGGVAAALWWEALLRVLWDSGLRIGVTLQINWSHVDLDGALLLAIAEHQKDSEDQQFMLGADTVEALRAIREPRRQLVFPWDRDRSMLTKHYQTILERAGLPAGRRDKFHKIRRSVASYYEKAGGNATELLGHSSRQVTRAYLDLTIVDRVQASKLLPRLVVNGRKDRA